MIAPAQDSSEVTVRSAQTPFVNEEFVDFTLGETKRAMQAALAEVSGQLGRSYDLVIGGRRVRTEGKIVSSNPARPVQAVGIHSKAGVEHVQQAMDAAQIAFTDWSRRPVLERAGLLFKAAGLIRERKFE